MKICSQCGTKVENNAVFCFQCGAKFPVEEQTTIDQQTEVPVDETSCCEPLLNANKGNSKLKIWISIFVIIATIVSVVFYNKKTEEKNRNIAKEIAETELYAIADEFGLEDVSVILTYNENYDWFDVVVDCSNFEDFSYEEMFEVDDDLDIFGVFIKKYISNGDEYSVYVDSIYKNGEKVYSNHKVNNSSNSNYIDVSSSDDRFWFAITAAQNLVEGELKSPSTADFPSSGSEYAVRRSGNSYIVSGYVDAQNSFGAVIRENWIATFTMGDTSGSKYSVSNGSVIFD